MMKKRRPKNLNLMTIHLPVPALVSILHRVSGAFLFVLIPVMLWLMQTSLAGERGFQETLAFLRLPISKLFCILAAWAFIHHTLAGLRHIALNAHLGLSLNYARATSRAVLILSAILTFWIGVWLW
jgi:succinate dehydrogenase / fumarate reductase cytochrome b subunit